MSIEMNDSNATKFVNWIIEKGVDGISPLSSANDLALEYKIDQGYENDDERVDSLINWETSKNFTSGFITGLGGIITLPISIPSALGASWVIQARMAGAIAHIYGHDLHEDRVRTLVLLSLLGDAGKEVIKSAGIKFVQKITEKTISKISGKALTEINKKIGFRLITKAGEKGIVNLTKFVPVAGGMVGGTFDAVACRMVGRTAKNLFAISSGSSLT
ncbi:EcsC family protein [Ferrovum myxofaciens]|uniref:EcsC family protein n=1 Tax=Ferrovum myxofaciens TaxID=416213 RepID=UPI003EB8D590